MADTTVDAKVGTGVDKHEIVGESATFTAGTTVFVWTRVTGADAGSTIKHVWKRDGKDVWTATLPVGSKRWSTQSRRAISKASHWEVEVQTADGKKLSSVTFDVN